PVPHPCGRGGIVPAGREMTEACPPATSGRAFSLNCGTEFDTLGKHSAACRDAGGAVWDRLKRSSFDCFPVLRIAKEDTQIVPAAVEYTVYIDIATIYPVKGEVATCHQKAVVALHIGNR